MTLSARRLCLGALAATLALPGCSEKPAGNFAATLEGPLEGQFRGGATFCRHPDSGDFLLVLQTPGDSAGLVLGRAAGAFPAPGPYALVAHSDSVGGRFWMRPALGKLEASGSYAFEVDEGEVRIVSADSSWVKGRFQVQMIARDTAFQIDTLARTVRRLKTEWQTVQGNFAAARAEPCAGLATQG